MLNSLSPVDSHRLIHHDKISKAEQVRNSSFTQHHGSVQYRSSRQGKMYLINDSSAQKLFISEDTDENEQNETNGFQLGSSPAATTQNSQVFEMTQTHSDDNATTKHSQPQKSARNRGFHNLTIKQKNRRK